MLRDPFLGIRTNFSHFYERDDILKKPGLEEKKRMIDNFSRDVMIISVII